MEQARSVGVPIPDVLTVEEIDTEAGSRSAMVMAERTSQRPHLVTAGLTPAELDAVMEQIGRSPDTPVTTTPVLCHGDLHASHVFVDDDLELCGIIDWGMWHGGSVIGELAAMSMGYAAEDFEVILAGYGTAVTDVSSLRRRLAVSMINQAIGHIAWHESIGNAGGTEHYVAVVRRALAEIN